GGGCFLPPRLRGRVGVGAVMPPRSAECPLPASLRSRGGGTCCAGGRRDWIPFSAGGGGCFLPPPFTGEGWGGGRSTRAARIAPAGLSRKGRRARSRAGQVVSGGVFSLPRLRGRVGVGAVMPPRSPECTYHLPPLPRGRCPASPPACGRGLWRGPGTKCPTCFRAIQPHLGGIAGQPAPCFEAYPHADGQAHDAVPAGAGGRA